MSTTEARRINIKNADGTFIALEHGDPTAPLVLCVHGFPDHARSFDALAPALTAAGYRCVAPWLRGYAPSTLEGPFDMGRIASDIVAIKRTLSPDRPAVLIGHDWGAVAGYVALAQSPGDFSHATMLAIPHPLALARNIRHQPAQLRLSWYMAFFQLRGVADFTVKRDKLAFIDRLWREWSPGYTPPIDYMRDLKRCLATSLPAPLEYYRSLFSLHPSAMAMRNALLKRTSSIEVPTLYLHGEDDGCMLPTMGDGQERYFARGFTGHTLRGLGHFLHLEAPDTVAAHITEFLAATPG
jgi:pimeloyl-ACP methyl ester carboxylesterase